MESENKKNPEINTDNIFKELSGGSLDFSQTDNQDTQKVKKDKIYYLKLSGNIFSILNIFIFVIFGLFFLYLKTQNNPENYSQSYLDPFCFILLDDQSMNTGDYCSSVASLVVDYNGKIEALKNDISQKISGIINDLYTYENFTNSKEISFLLEKQNNRLMVLDILNDFDRLKLDFSGMDKKKVECSNITISDNNEMDVICKVYSSSWEFNITGSSGDMKTSQLQGTSISVAASFLNFIEKNAQYNFELLEKQKVFTSEGVVSDGPYIKQTTLNLKLKYNNLKSNLSL